MAARAQRRARALRAPCAASRPFSKNVPHVRRRGGDDCSPVLYLPLELRPVSGVAQLDAMRKPLIALLAIVHGVRSQCPAWVSVGRIDGTSASAAGCSEDHDRYMEAQGLSAFGNGQRGSSAYGFCKTACGGAFDAQWMEFYPRSFKNAQGIIFYYHCYCWYRESCTNRTRTTKLVGYGNPIVAEYREDAPCPSPPPVIYMPPPPSPSPPPPPPGAPPPATAESTAVAAASWVVHPRRCDPWDILGRGVHGGHTPSACRRGPTNRPLLEPSTRSRT